jgi:hypothetical protein
VSQFPDDAKLAVLGSWIAGTDEQNERIATMLDSFGWFATFFVDPASVGTAVGPTPEGLQKIIKAGHDVGLIPISGSDVSKDRTSLSEAAGVDIAVADCVEPGSRALAESAGFQLGRGASVDGPISTPEVSDWLEFPSTTSIMAEHMDLRERWDEIEELDGGILHLVGHVTECGEDEDLWAALECNLAWFCGMTGVWYPTLRQLHSVVKG